MTEHTVPEEEDDIAPVPPVHHRGSGSSSFTGDWPNGPFPDELKGWNWGAFGLTWIWGISNKVWLSFLGFLPYGGFPMAIILGIFGNEWAWRNRKFKDIAEFKEVQKIWASWGIGVLIASAVMTAIFVFGIMFYTFEQSPTNYQEENSNSYQYD